MTVDMSINLGHIITLVGILITFITWGQSIKWHIIAIDKRVEHIEKQLEEQTKLILATAIISEKLGTFEKRLERLENRKFPSMS
jgi:hypothetical protein